MRKISLLLMAVVMFTAPLPVFGNESSTETAIVEVAKPKKNPFKKFGLKIRDGIKFAGNKTVVPVGKFSWDKLKKGRPVARFVVKNGPIGAAYLIPMPRVASDAILLGSRFATKPLMAKLETGAHGFAEMPTEAVQARTDNCPKLTRKEIENAANGRYILPAGNIECISNDDFDLKPFNGDRKILMGMTLTTIGKLGLDRLEVHNDFCGQGGPLVELAANTPIWVDAETKEPRFMEGCKCDGKETLNRLQLVGELKLPVTQIAQNTQPAPAAQPALPQIIVNTPAINIPPSQTVFQQSAPAPIPTNVTINVNQKYEDVTPQRKKSLLDKIEQGATIALKGAGAYVLIRTPGLVGDVLDNQKDIAVITRSNHRAKTKPLMAEKVVPVELAAKVVKEAKAATATATAERAETQLLPAETSAI
jgi:hypothetical protein